MYLFQVSGWLEYENEEHNGADVLKSQQTAISDTETSCLSLQIKPLNRELHWRSHYPDGSRMIYRGGGAALTLICEPDSQQASFLTSEEGEFVAAVEAGFALLPVDPGMPPGQEEERAMDSCRSHRHLSPWSRLCGFWINAVSCPWVQGRVRAREGGHWEERVATLGVGVHVFCLRVLWVIIFYVFSHRGESFPYRIEVKCTYPKMYRS